MAKAKKPTEMTRDEFAQYCENRDREWLISQLHITKCRLANCEKRCREMQFENTNFFIKERDENKKADILAKREENFAFILKKLGYKPKKLLIYYKDEGIRGYVCDSSNCDHFCSTCDNHYKQDCTGIFVLYDFEFFVGTTLDDFDGFCHSELTGIDANFDDVKLSGVTKIIDMETDAVLFETDEEV